MHVLILGTRGVPAKHGGFETFAQDLALYLKNRGHQVTVYCQIESGDELGEDAWRGIRRILIPAKQTPFGTIAFDFAANWHSCHEKGVILTLGYNTGIFSFLYRFRHIPSVMNMDGIEWKRKKWTLLQRGWLRINEWTAARAANHLVADNPEIVRHLLRHTSPGKISMIPYGATPVLAAPVRLIQRYGLNPKNYYILVARPEPENSILEIVRAYSLKRRGIPLVVLGSYVPKSNRYHRAVMYAAGPEVKFLGSVYDGDLVKALRFHAKAYLHGHTVGGTNPSLVEALAAGNAVIARDNRFNRWVAGQGARYFTGSDDLAEIIDLLESEPSSLRIMEAESRKRHVEAFTQDKILSAYEELLLQFAHARDFSSCDVGTV